MKINNIKAPVFSTYTDSTKEEYDTALKKRANLVGNTLMAAGAISTAALIYANISHKTKSNISKTLINKIKDFFNNKH